MKQLGGQRGGRGCRHWHALSAQSANWLQTPTPWTRRATYHQEDKLRCRASSGPIGRNVGAGKSSEGRERWGCVTQVGELVSHDHFSTGNPWLLAPSTLDDPPSQPAIFKLSHRSSLFFRSTPGTDGNSPPTPQLPPAACWVSCCPCTTNECPRPASSQSLLGGKFVTQIQFIFPNLLSKITVLPYSGNVRNVIERLREAMLLSGLMARAGLRLRRPPGAFPFYGVSSGVSAHSTVLSHSVSPPDLE